MQLRMARGLGMCSKGSGRMSVGRGVAGGTPACSGGCLGRAWLWCAPLVVEVMVGGLMHGFAGALLGVSANCCGWECPQTSRAPSHSQGKAFPSQGARGPAAHPDLPVQPWLKHSPGADASSRMWQEFLCPALRGWDGARLMWLEGRCGRGRSCSQAQPGKMDHSGEDGEGSQPLIPAGRPEQRALSSRCSCA